MVFGKCMALHTGLLSCWSSSSLPSELLPLSSMSPELRLALSQ